MPKAKNTVEVFEEVTTAIRVGKDIVTVKNTADGRGVRVEARSGSIFIPFGSEGKAVIDTVKTRIDKGFGTAKGKRRSAVQLAAQVGLSASKTRKAKAK